MNGKPEPTKEESEMARFRIEQLDHLMNRCDWGNTMPGPEALAARQRWNYIMAEQDKYEAKYC